jgi:hypothetical protein
MNRASIHGVRDSKQYKKNHKSCTKREHLKEIFNTATHNGGKSNIRK